MHREFHRESCNGLGHLRRDECRHGPLSSSGVVVELPLSSPTRPSAWLTMSSVRPRSSATLNTRTSALPMATNTFPIAFNMGSLSAAGRDRGRMGGLDG
jgi:hypothetical protein